MVTLYMALRRALNIPIALRARETAKGDKKKMLITFERKVIMLVRVRCKEMICDNETARVSRMIVNVWNRVCGYLLFPENMYYIDAILPLSADCVHGWNLWTLLILE